ncbi:unnamed protein product [Rhizophagus irregularis]|nr:unnamed protein product [Rhizophagus irregularis]
MKPNFKDQRVERGMEEGSSGLPKIGKRRTKVRLGCLEYLSKNGKKLRFVSGGLPKNGKRRTFIKIHLGGFPKNQKKEPRFVSGGFPKNRKKEPRFISIYES